MESSSRRVIRFVDGVATSADDLLAVEEPLEIRLAGVPVAVLMRTPGMERELALGFGLTEGILLSPAEMSEVVRLEDGDRWEMVLAPGVHIDPEQFRRSMYTSSSCGVCGKASIDAVKITARPLPAGPVVASTLIHGLPDSLLARQRGFASTGGLHAAAIFDVDGSVLSWAEDIGRHNATDKAIGALAAARWPLGEVLLQVSGRVSFEIAQKAAVAGIPIVLGVSAASSLAVELADDLGMTLIGFVRGEGFVVYAGEERVKDEPATQTVGG
ncbi:MAG: formate dehydrogenase accessory sulfurtransferase FdhD [Acidimicrobiia bacterium]